MTGDEDRYADIEVDVLDDAGVRAVIDNALARAGCTWEDLQEQAKAGSFSSEIASGPGSSCPPSSLRRSDLDRKAERRLTSSAGTRAGGIARWGLPTGRRVRPS